MGVCREVLQILTRFQTKKCNFPHSCSSLENYTRFQTEMGKVYTRFQTKTAQKPNPKGRHIPIWLILGSTPPPSSVRPKNFLSLSLFLSFFSFHSFHFRSQMKIRPGQVEKNEKASLLYRLRKSTIDEKMKGCVPLNGDGMWPRSLGG